MRLSVREGQVLVELALNGGTDAQIGERLGIARNTVRTHVQHLRVKLGARSKTELVSMFWRETR